MGKKEDSNQNKLSGLCSPPHSSLDLLLVPNPSPSRQNAFSQLQGISYHCVCVGCQCCTCSPSLTLSCSKLVTFCFALSKEDRQCLSERNPQQSVLKSLCHPPAVPFGTVQLQKCRIEILCFVIFLFETQHNFGFSDTEHFFCCCGVPSCCIFYAIPFLENPWWRSALWASRPPCRCVVKVRDASSGCASSLSLLPLPVFPAVPWFVNCLHLFCQPTCTKCKKEFLNR